MYKSVRSIYDSIFAGMLSTVLLLTLFAMSNAIIMSIYERSHEIGIIRAIGGRPNQVTGLFLVESLILAVVGILVADGLILVLAKITDAMGGIPMPPPPGSTRGYNLNLRIDSSGLLGINTMALVAASIASIVPSFLAGRKNIARLISVSAAVLLMVALPQAAEAKNKEAEKALTEVEKYFPPVDEKVGFVLEMNFVNFVNNAKDGETTYRLVRKGLQSVAVDLTEKKGERMAILTTTDGWWIQKEGARSPLRIAPAQRLFGQAVNGDILNVRFSMDYKGVSIKKEGSKSILELAPRSDSKSPAYSKILLQLGAEFKVESAEFYSLEGKHIKSASYEFAIWDGKPAVKSSKLFEKSKPEDYTNIIFGKYKKYDVPSSTFSIKNIDKVSSIVEGIQL